MELKRKQGFKSFTFITLKILMEFLFIHPNTLKSKENKNLNKP